MFELVLFICKWHAVANVFYENSYDATGVGYTIKL